MVVSRITSSTQAANARSLGGIKVTHRMASSTWLRRHLPSGMQRGIRLSSPPATFAYVLGLNTQPSETRQRLLFVYNLGYEVPFVPTCGVYPEEHWCFKNISSIGRGKFSSMWEMASAIYGDTAPYTKQVVNSHGYRPEGASQPIINNGPHVGDGPPGQGTLTFYGMTPPPLPT
eukprot:m.66266 g.66266  ORF g.66266 m.66266 type:complete len:174 (+) comp13726_c0_seq4:1000-1521(+)